MRGNLLLHKLELANLTPKSLAVIRIAHAGFQAGADQPRGSGSDRVATVIQAGHGDLRSLRPPRRCGFLPAQPHPGKPAIP